MRLSLSIAKRTQSMTQWRIMDRRSKIRFSVLVCWSTELIFHRFSASHQNASKAFLSSFRHFYFFPCDQTPTPINKPLKP